MRFLIAGCFFLTYSDAAQRPNALTRFTYTEYHMGVDARIVVYARDKTTAEKACFAAFARIAELDTIMSDYRVDSELNLLCAKAGGPPVHVSDDLFKVLQRAAEVSRRSGGVFDVTVGPVVQLWRKARKTGVLPDPALLQRARQLVGWQKVMLDARRHTVRLTVRGMKLDLGGIGKGYADDEAQKILRANGITSALVEMGGDIVVSQAPPGAGGWTIRVPNAGKGDTPMDLHFANQAISTSGDTEQFVVIGGVRYSHIIDPRTGQALTTRIQVSVIARDGFTSDPLSKVITFLAPKERAKFLKNYPGVKTFMRVLPNR